MKKRGLSYVLSAQLSGINLSKFLCLLLLISISPKFSLAQKQQTFVKIHLTDSLGKPIAGASIYSGKKGKNITTDQAGYGQLIKDVAIRYNISHLNYKSLNFIISPTDTLLSFILEAKPNLLDEISLTATALPTQLRKISSSVSIIDKKDPSLHQVQTVDEALAFIPGVMVDRGRGLTNTGTHTGVIMRGTGSANRTLILKDGVPINDGYTGGVSEWNSMASNSLERIEVVRGPGSALYGSNSMGGTINMVTQTPQDKPTMGAEVRYGSMNTIQANTKYGQRFGKGWGAIGFVEYKKTDGYIYLKEEEWLNHFQRPSMELLNANAKLSYDLSAGGRLTFTGDFNWQHPIHGTAIHYVDNTTTGNYQLRYQDNTAKFIPDIIFYYNKQTRKSVSDRWVESSQDFTFNFDGQNPLQAYGLIAKVSRRFGAHSLTTGADLRFTNAVYDRTFAGDKEQYFSGNQDFISLFINDDIQFSDQLFANLGLRFDHWNNRNGYFFNNQSGTDVSFDYPNGKSSVLTPKIGLTYTVNPSLRLRSVYATGFRAPGAFHMYTATVVGSRFRLGNPNLLPERMRYSFDLGYDFQWSKNLTWSSTVYASQYSNFIGDVEINGSDIPAFLNTGTIPVMQYTNIGRVSLWGFETYATYRIWKSISLQSSYFYNASKIIKHEQHPQYEGNEMSNSPRHVFTGALLYQGTKYQASIWSRYTGSHFSDLQNTPEGKMGEVNIFDFKLNRQIGSLGINLTINNVLNKLYYGSYTRSSYYYAPGRSVFFGLRYDI